MKLFFRSLFCLFMATALPALGCSVFPEREAEVPRFTLLLEDGSRVPMEMDEYLLGVLAGEMPASFPEEALKAQAVASRSYAVHTLAQGKHGDNTLCAQSCCQIYLTEPQRREKWGQDCDFYTDILRRCIAQTKGQLLLYGSEAAETCFHASSLGCTESSEALWGQAVPYLVSVSSPENSESVPKLTSLVRFSPEELYTALGGEVIPSAGIGRCLRDAAGRVESIELLGRSYSGTALRSLLGLRSTNFTVEYDGSEYIFRVNGSGHGVGMSQYGAKLMAEQGASYRDILAHYYPGTEFGIGSPERGAVSEAD